MKKKQWQRALAHLYDEHVGPHLPRWRGRHPFEYQEERYLLQRLADAIDVMQFADRHDNTVESARLRAEISTIVGAGQRVANFDERTSLGRVLAEHRGLIASELNPGDLPPHDRQFLDEAGVRDPDLELLLAIHRLRERADQRANADERGMHRGAVEIAVRETQRIEEAMREVEVEPQGPRQPPDRPPKRPFKGLGGIGKGFGLVIADTLVLSDWPIVTPEAAKAGAMASFALGWDGLLCGIGDLRGE
jgi:hypothetical protein